MLATLGTHIWVWEPECEEEPGTGRGLGPGKSPGSRAEHPFFWVQGCNPTDCQGLETALDGSQWLRVMPTTAAPRWTKAVRIPRTWGGSWVRAAGRQARAEPQAVWGRETQSLEALRAVPGDLKRVAREGDSGRHREGDAASSIRAFFFPSLPGFVRSGSSPAAGNKKGEKEGAFTWL